MTQPVDPNQPPPPPAYGTPPPPPPYGAPPPGYPPPPPSYGGAQGYGQIPGQRVNDPAPMGPRLVARLIDGVLEFAVIFVLLLAVGVHLFSTTTNSDGTTASFSLYGGDFFKAILIGLVITAGYEVGMLVTKGATLGKMAMGIRVAQLENGQNPTLGQAAIRWVIPAACGGIFPLLQLVMFLSPFFDSTHRNRGWYDLAAKTIAVRTR